MHILKLTTAELNHVKSVMFDCAENGDYYGNKEQYWKRHFRINKKIERWGGVIMGKPNRSMADATPTRGAVSDTDAPTPTIPRAYGINP